MIRSSLAAVLASAFLVQIAAAETPYTGEPSEPIAVVDGMPVYGQPMPEGKAVNIAEAIAQIDTLAGSPHKFEGRISKVCQTKGCWLILSDGEQLARVMFGKHDFYIPKDTTGDAVVYGVLTEKSLEEAMAKHLAADAGADPESVQGTVSEYRITATSVLIKPAS